MLDRSPVLLKLRRLHPNGHTVGSFVIGVPIVGPRIGIPELNPNPFEPVGIFLTYPFVLAAAKDAPYQSMAELAEHAKSNKVILGHFGAPLIPTKVSLAMAKNMSFAYASDAAFDALDCNTIASGDVDVMNTTIQLVLPCLDKIKILAAVTEERISLVLDAPTVGELDSLLKVGLWNGLFVHKDTPADACAKLEEVAKATMASDRAKNFVAETGAQVYWKDSSASAAQIEADTTVFDRLNEILK